MPVTPGTPIGQAPSELHRQLIQAFGAKTFGAAGGVAAASAGSEVGGGERPATTGESDFLAYPNLPAPTAAAVAVAAAAAAGESSFVSSLLAD